MARAGKENEKEKTEQVSYGLPRNQEAKRHSLADPTGLEPATSAVTGQRSNQLSYGS